jgi:hypothetical protein
VEDVAKEEKAAQEWFNAVSVVLKYLEIKQNVQQDIRAL